LDRIYGTKENTLIEQQLRLASWRNLLASSRQRAESTIQSSGSVEPLISMLNAKSELTNAISKKPLLEQQTDGELSVFFNGGNLMDMLKKAGEVRGDHGNGRPVLLLGAALGARQPYGITRPNKRTVRIRKR